MSKPRVRITTRELAADDVGLLARWLQGTGLGTPAPHANVWRRALEDPRILCRIGFEDTGEPIGFYRLDLAPDSSSELTLVIAPDCRGRGLGGALLELVLAEARALGLRRLVAMVQDGNAVAREFFLAAGFEIIEHENPGFVHLERIVHSGDRVPPLEITP